MYPDLQGELAKAEMQREDARKELAVEILNDERLLAALRFYQENQDYSSAWNAFVEALPSADGKPHIWLVGEVRVVSTPTGRISGVLHRLVNIHEARGVQELMRSEPNKRAPTKRLMVGGKGARKSKPRAIKPAGITSEYASAVDAAWALVMAGGVTSRAYDDPVWAEATAAVAAAKKKERMA